MTLSSSMTMKNKVEVVEEEEKTTTTNTDNYTTASFKELINYSF